MTKQADDWGPEGFLLGMLTGAVIGAGVAILLGSETGARLREGLADRVESLRQTAKGKWEDAKTATEGVGL
jgi:gas vesicle protein